MNAINVKKPEKLRGVQRGLDPSPRDKGVMPEPTEAMKPLTLEESQLWFICSREGDE